MMEGQNFEIWKSDMSEKDIDAAKKEIAMSNFKDGGDVNNHSFTPDALLGKFLKEAMADEVAKKDPVLGEILGYQEEIKRISSDDSIDLYTKKDSIRNYNNKINILSAELRRKMSEN